ncbi:CDP-alcohol phosphatidyltransferase family protein [Marinobacter halophilus]|uniref:CDP-alcohol phosphatidyltransferase n=1 Tax=Marinobacter halophilus TaxID=1323740 RepID=A0A2T1K8N7_9GAMM|nr:CDP-alcohol phosphatidyltransferase family protein [Marinobacter halophilus]PSF06511.1 CDP-alcohol phosphatidyltransferase [Marinobacter halophilus]GGC73259.1 membrane protein [Marinobacter halophilus]
MDSIQPASNQIPSTAKELGWAGILLAFTLLTMDHWFNLPGTFLIATGLLFLLQSGFILARWPAKQSFGWANRTTLLRSVLVLPLVAWAPFLSLSGPAGLWFYAVACLLALILDGADGKVARATNSHSDFGARFDMELDALFILGLCLAVFALDKAGVWVLVLGLMRYLYVAASCYFEWLNQALPESFRRKTVCVWQVVTLMVAVVPPIPPVFASVTLAIALLLLAWSFHLDVRWLFIRRMHHEH